MSKKDSSAPEARWYKWLQRQFGSNPGTTVLGAGFFILFAWLLWNLTGNLAGASDSSVAASLNRLVALLGALTGWAVGILFAPFSSEEEQRFKGIGKVISAFVAGYLISKLDLFMKQYLFTDNGAPDDAWVRVGFFVCAFLLVAITVFIQRLYAFRGDKNTAS
ncbi:hypothetical protein [Pseudomonas carassii]|uniref:Uncharacterized protein n=1 Tax=Pseudomonas carassii TaxID=3115855 RepID=A0ABU7H6Q9_9PSED|nr:hypothetical protein [Pseudomonas sp. 137P]MEE1886703.1 hypothetical protein [Pseudomonas sp. 137P]